MTDPYGYLSQNKPNSNDWYTGSDTKDATQNSGWDSHQADYNINQNSFVNYGYNTPSSPAQSSYSNYYAQQPNMFIPTIPAEQEKAFITEDIENEPPLLEELGFNFDHIRLKTLAVLNPLGTTSSDVIADQDLAGPLVFCILFGASLLLHGKIHFGHIYGIGLVGCTGMYALLNLMAQERSISFTNTASVLGYCLLPMSLLSLLAAVLSLQALVGYVVVALAVFWSGLSSSKLFSIALSMDGVFVRYLRYQTRIQKKIS